MSKEKIKQLPKSQTSLTAFFKAPSKTSKSVCELSESRSLQKAVEKSTIHETVSGDFCNNMLNDGKRLIFSNQLNSLKQRKEVCDLNLNEKCAKVKLRDTYSCILSSPSKKSKLQYDLNIVKTNTDEELKLEEMQDIFSDHIDFDKEFNDSLLNTVDLEENLDLSQWQSCVVLDCNVDSIYHILKLKSLVSMSVGKCLLKDFWTNTNFETNCIVSVLAIKDENNQYSITNQGGYIVLWPDNLISGTEIVNSLFCTRRSVLQDRFKGVDSGSKSMILGNLIHEIFQVCISKKINKFTEIQIECKNIIETPKFLYMLYDVGMTEMETISEIDKFIPQISNFVNTYVLSSNFQSNDVNKKQIKWQGTIEKILDIEENIWSPKYGISGRIDVTVLVKIHDRHTKKKKIMPLELKTGKASNSAEHRGQVILYTMLMTEIFENNFEFKNCINEGLLLYLRDSITIHEISAKYSEKRDLILLRNKLAYYIEHWKTDIDNVILPDPINHHSACEKCPYLTLCSLYLSRDSNHKISDKHLLAKLKNEAIGHLSPGDIDYFLFWCKLLMIEDGEETDGYKRKDLWNIPSEQRERKGKCLHNMVISSTSVFDSYFEHTFVKYDNTSKVIPLSSLLQTEEYIIISSDNKYGQASGTISNVTPNSISVLINRDLTKRNSHSTNYTLDSFESQFVISYNLTSLSILMDNTDASNKLRRIIVDKTLPHCTNKISKNAVEKIKNILNKLNSIQQRAILTCLSAEDYFLIRGMPGTGKTHTLVALIKALVTLNMSVLITSHTHSAVDNIFLRLTDLQVTMLRIGSSNKIHKQLQFCSESVLLNNCKTTDDLKKIFDSVNIVGVTCLGSNHSLLAKRTFDVCIIDESTQVLQCSVIRPLLAAKKFILVGDPDQLPPIVRNSKARALGLDESLFFRLDKPESTISLTMQYRMNETIMELANRLTYNNKLICGSKTVSTSTIKIDFSNDTMKNINKLAKECLSNKIEDSVIFLDTGKTFDKCNYDNLYKSYNIDEVNNRKYTNICEAMIILNLIQFLLKASIKKYQIGVISPFRDQISLLKKIINSNLQKNISLSQDNSCDNSDIEINTVDQYQGRDKDIILYSCTKTYSKENMENNNKENQILDDKRRLTVAITRSKCKLIIIGDVSTLNMYKPFNELFKIYSSERPVGKLISLSKMESNNEFSWNDIL